MTITPKIDPNDTLRNSYPKLNLMIDNVNNFQDQINQMVIQGDSSVEAAQARVASEKTFATLKARLDDRDVKLNQKATQTDIENINSELLQKADVLEVQTLEKDIKTFESVKAYGVQGNGSNETTAIQTALNNAEGILYFPDGNYKWDTTLVINKSNLILEFSGNAYCEYTGSLNTAAITFQGSEVSSSSMISSSATKGATSITVNSIPSGLTKGDWILLTSTELFHSFRPTYTKNEWVMVKSISGNVINLESRLNFSYGTGTTRVNKQNFLFDVGVRGLKLTNPEAYLTYGVNFDVCFNPIVDNCRLTNTQRCGISFDRVLFGAVENTHVLITRDTDSLNYGIVASASSYCNFNNNRIQSFRTSIDLTRLTSFSNVVGNTSHKGNINTHDAYSCNVSNNTINNGHILIRGWQINVHGNYVSSYADGQFNGLIMVTEAGELGTINITSNIIEGPDNTGTACGVFSGQLETSRLIIANNIMLNVSRGVSVSSVSNEVGQNEIIISGNIMKLKQVGGIEPCGLYAHRGHNIHFVNNSVEQITGATGRGVDCWASGGSWKNFIISGNKWKNIKGFTYRFTSQFSNVIIKDNIGDNCDNFADVTSAIGSRLVKDNIHNGTIMAST